MPEKPPRTESGTFSVAVTGPDGTVVIWEGWDIHQVRADAARILRLESGLTDLCELTRADADELIGELRRAVAQERVSDES
jgi:hypothetical protein